MTTEALGKHWLTFATPDTAITTFWETLHPAIVCISLLMAALGKDERRYIS